MRRRFIFALIWIGWFIYFFAVEIPSVLNEERGDSFSEQVWALETLPYLGPVITALIAGFMLWLFFHLVAPAIYYHTRRWHERWREWKP